MCLPSRRLAYFVVVAMLLYTASPLTAAAASALSVASPGVPFPDAPEIPPPPMPDPPTDDLLPPFDGQPAPPAAPLDGVAELQRLLRGLSAAGAGRARIDGDPAAWSMVGLPTAPVDGPVTVQVGPVASVLPGGSLVSLNTPLTGLQMGTALGRGSFTGVVGSVAPVRHADTLAGFDALGPYYLTRTPVVAGSELVTRQGVALRRDVDYTLDPATGALQFLRGPAPTAAETLRVSYEVATNGLAGGTVYGARGAMPLGGGLTLGLTHLGLAADADAARRAVQGLDLDWQPGNGLGVQMAYAASPGAPRPQAKPQRITDEALPIAADTPLGRQVFRVRAVPVQEGSEVVRLGARTLTPRTDYLFDARTGELRLRASLLPPQTGVVLVSYTTQPAMTDDGDAAMTAALTYAGGRGSLGASYRQVDGGFAPLDGMRVAAGTSLDWNGTLALTDAVSLMASGGTGSTPLEDGRTSDQQRQTIGISVNTPLLPALTVQRSAFATEAGDLSERTTSDSAALSWARGPVWASLNWDRSHMRSQSALVAAGGAAPAPNTNDTQNAALSVGYQAAPNLNLGVTLTGNSGDAIFGGTRQTSAGHGLATNISYAPTSRLTATAGWQTSDSRTGGEAAGGTQSVQQTTAGLTWAAPGGLLLAASVAMDAQRFGTGTQDGGTVDIAQGNTTTTVTAGYQRDDRANASVTLTDTAGSYAGATRAQSLVATASVRPSDRLRLAGNAWLSESRADASGLPTASSANSSLSAEYRVAGPWHLEARTQREHYTSGYEAATAHASDTVALAWKPREGLAVRAIGGVGDADGTSSGRATVVGLTVDASKPGLSVGAGVRRVSGGGSAPGHLWQSVASSPDGATSLVSVPTVPADAREATAVSLHATAHSGRHELTAQGEWVDADRTRVVYDLSWRYRTHKSTSIALTARQPDGGDTRIGLDASIRF